MYNRQKIGNKGFGENLDENVLLEYLEGKMSHSQQHQLETILDADPFLRDALDGLAEIKDKEQLKVIAGQINMQLRRQIKQRRSKRRGKKEFKDRWTWIFILIVLLLIVLSWWIIKLNLSAQ